MDGNQVCLEQASMAAATGGSGHIQRREGELDGIDQDFDDTQVEVKLQGGLHRLFFLFFLCFVFLCFMSWGPTDRVRFMQIHIAFDWSYTCPSCHDTHCKMTYYSLLGRPQLQFIIPG